MIDASGGLWADPIITAVDRAGADGGLLQGCTFVAKDLFDVAGEVTGAGNPRWAAEAGRSNADADAITSLLAAGARLVGKSLTDELAFSLSGTNVHFGTPRNPAAPGRVPGGSSSGSASAVAAGTCDLGLGTDTGGSIRVPASYCGIWGIRPTHGRVSERGLVPLAPSFDTVGWFARRGCVLADAGRVLLRGSSTTPARRIVVVEELLDLADDSCRASLRDAAELVAASTGLPLEPAADAASSGGWWGEPGHDSWLATFRTIQSAEAWTQHGSWVRRVTDMGPGIRSRFLAGGEVTVEELARALAVRERVRRRLTEMTAGGTVLAIPSASGAAPPPDLDDDSKGDLRLRTLMLTSGAGLAGLPAVSMPLATCDGLPIGLCLVGPAGSDESLLALAETVDA